MNGFLQDSNGNKSSKRLAGFIALAGLFIILGVGVFRGSDLTPWAWPMVGLVAGLFGAGLAERKK